MKRIFIIGSLALAFIVAGCSDKANVESNQDATSSEVSSAGGANNGANGTGSNSTISGDMTDTNTGSTGSTSAFAGSNGDSNLHSVYFKFDKFNIDDANISIIKSNAKDINENGYKEVKVEGNTDEWGNDEYNFALALKRASSTRDALISNGVSADIIKLVSYGESKPICVEKTKECWQKNRRVDFVPTK